MCGKFISFSCCMICAVEFRSRRTIFYVLQLSHYELELFSRCFLIDYVAILCTVPVRLAFFLCADKYLSLSYHIFFVKAEI